MEKQPSETEIELDKQLKEEYSEQFLRSIFNSVQASIFVVDVLENRDFRYVGANPVHERWTGLRSSEIKGKTPEQILPPDDARSVRQHYSDCVRYGTTISYEQYLPFQNIPYWWLTTLTPLRDNNARIYRLVGTSTNITERKQAEEALRLQAEREQVLGVMQERIRQSLDLDRILQRTVKEVRQFLNCDRVLIYRLFPDHSGMIVVESHTARINSVLGNSIEDPCFNLSPERLENYRRGRIQVIENVHNSGLDPCYRNLLTSLQVQANLVVPIICDNQLWGLLIAQNCQKTRSWQSKEIDLLKQLAIQVGIAIQQAELHQRVKCLNTALESEVQQRTAELQMTLKYEALIGRITEKIRDSLDENHILQTTTRELVQVLPAQRAQIELYNPSRSQATIVHEYTTQELICQGISRQISDFPEIYQPLLHKQILQFVDRLPLGNPQICRVNRCACPIFDDQGFLGNIWLIRPANQIFNSLETNLIQHIATECAIAIRQARLYESSQAQVRELEKLERLKSEFLKTLSHELRTPITSIRLAVETLESLLEYQGIKIDPEDSIGQLLQILNIECQRQSKLVNDLLTLTYLDAESEPPAIETIDLLSWLPLLVEPFRTLTRERQQQLILDIDGDIPEINSNLCDIERIIAELLTNASKYTPEQGIIRVNVWRADEQILINVSNSGVEIPPEELSRIFAPFYRIPHHDPWRYSGTGLGLALVHKLIKPLNATIDVTSANAVTTFTLTLPI
jgi:PAS domain S-box-containing protein